MFESLRDTWKGTDRAIIWQAARMSSSCEFKLRVQAASHAALVSVARKNCRRLAALLSLLAGNRHISERCARICREGFLPSLE
jgi:hypothetical protein